MSKVFSNGFREGSPIKKILTWGVTGASNFSIYLGNYSSKNLSSASFRSNKYNGSHEFSGDIDGTLFFSGKFDDAATIDIDLDGVKLVQWVKPVKELPTGNYQPCSEYSIPNARASCKNGYKKINKTQYRLVKRTKTPRQGTKTTYGEWHNTKPYKPANIVGTFGQTYFIETGNNYFCTPESGCNGDIPILANTVNYPLDYDDSVGFSIPESSSQLSFRLSEEARLQKLEEERLRQEAYTQLQQQQQQQAIRNQGFIPSGTESQKGTKYRVIDPPATITERGKVIPKIRYQTVRYLTPENVSTLIYRKYEVQSVNPDTPLSSRSAYPPSVIEHSKAKLEGKPAPSPIIKSDVTKRNEIGAAIKQEIIRFKARRRVIS